MLIHGVSVGEVKASQSLVAALRPHHDVVVSASTDSGLLVARELYPDLTVVRFPLDFRPVVARFLRCLQPTAIGGRVNHGRASAISSVVRLSASQLTDRARDPA